MASQLKETMDTAEAARRAIRSVPGMAPVFLCSAARRAPRTAPVTQPVPTRFTRRLFSWPKAARKIRSFPPLSEIQQSLSTAPVSRITIFRPFSLISLKNAASSSRWENVPTLSTPLWAAAPVSTVWISELFPFSTPDQALPGHEAAHRLTDAFFLAIGGAPLGFFYKAVNTMDSMLGYTEPPYKNIGLVPAKMDDFFNFLPARLSAFFLLAAGFFLRLDVKNGWRIFRRDRYKHASPNSAQTESVCAGLLGLRLAGDAWYHGVLHKKEFIGDAVREIEYADIPHTCRLMELAAVLALIVCCAIKACFIF